MLQTYGYIRVSSKGQNEDRQRQAEGIAAAKKRGVKFGRSPLPENFHHIHKKWRNKKMTLRQATNACRMPLTTFYEKTMKNQNSEMCTFSNEIPSLN